MNTTAATQTLILGDAVVARFLMFGDTVIDEHGEHARIISKPADSIESGRVAYWATYGGDVENARPVSFDREAFVSLVTIL